MLTGGGEVFQAGLEAAKKYTYPYAGLRRKHDGTVFSTVAAFIVVNAEGWCITAKHVFDEIARADHSIAGAASIDGALQTMRGQQGGNAKQRTREIHKLERQKADSLSSHAEIWAAGADWESVGSRAVDVRLHPMADLAAFRLDPFTPAPDCAYPVLRSDSLTPGVSVCRIGFPWHAVDAEFENNNFDVKAGFPAPLFAIEGIVSRFGVEETPDGSKATYIQTSSPGLRGQSGGPLFDVDGRLCGLQSSTIHLDLGFDATYEREGQKRVERQFLNVGQAVHVDDIASFLKSQGVTYSAD